MYNTQAKQLSLMHKSSSRIHCDSLIISCISWDNIACDCSIDADASEDCENELEWDVLKFLDEHKAGNSTLHTIYPLVFKI